VPSITLRIVLGLEVGFIAVGPDIVVKIIEGSVSSECILLDSIAGFNNNNVESCAVSAS